MKGKQICTQRLFEFAQKVRQQNPDIFISSFDIDSLFTNVSLDDIIDLCVDKFSRVKPNVSVFLKMDLNVC